MSYTKPIFTIRDRDDKKSLWVNEKNIWDVPSKSISPDVLEAIVSAYFIGVEDIKEAMNKVEIVGRFNSEFKNE